MSKYSKRLYFGSPLPIPAWEIKVSIKNFKASKHQWDHFLYFDRWLALYHVVKNVTGVQFHLVFFII